MNKSVFLKEFEKSYSKDCLHKLLFKDEDKKIEKKPGKVFYILNLDTVLKAEKNLFNMARADCDFVCPNVKPCALHSTASFLKNIRNKIEHFLENEKLLCKYFVFAEGLHEENYGYGGFYLEDVYKIDVSKYRSQRFRFLNV